MSEGGEGEARGQQQERRQGEKPARRAEPLAEVPARDQVERAGQYAEQRSPRQSGRGRREHRGQ